MGAHVCWHELRTTDVAAARAFYAEVAGLAARDEDGRVILARDGVDLGEVSTLPERAIAQGAPSHWLGHLAVADVEAAAERFVARGAARLGPTRVVDGVPVVGLRDPFGAAVALSARTAPSGRLAWYELNTLDAERAASVYAELCGWRVTGRLPIGPELGDYLSFAWDDGGDSVGGMISSVRRPGVHPHWLYSFDVDDLDRALAAVAARGGELVGDVRTTPTGARVAYCHDPTRAAFGLRRRA